MTVEPPASCRLEVAADGLPHRGEAVLRRELGRIPSYIERLRGGGGKGEPDDDPEPPTVDELVAAIDARDPTTLGVAAFLAGRGRVRGDAGARLDRSLTELVESAPVGALDLLAEGYVEAAFSLALRGDVERAQRALAPLVGNDADPSIRWLAAAYLAQLGDPSGWPALRHDLREGIDHVRLMAARQLVMFVPYDGTEVGGSTVDVEAELRRLADDPSEWVRHEVPGLLDEAGFAS